MLYLLRHGEAESDTLTERGIAGVERVAAWAARAGVAVDEIRHSGKRRAEQTANIFATSLGAEVMAIDGITPNDDPVAFARSIEPDRNILIVSHLPFLGSLVAALTGSASVNVAFRPATLAGLAPVAGGFVVDFVVHPDVLP